MLEETETMIEIKKQIEKYKDVALWSVKFGRYKGCTYDAMKLDFNYMTWYIRNIEPINNRSKKIYLYLSAIVSYNRLLHYMHNSLDILESH